MEWNPDTPIRMSGVVRESIVDGPGIRYTVFVQGCPHHCEGCHNPQTHDPAGGYQSTVGRLFNDIAKQHLIQGVTFSGGEPFAQPRELLILAKHLREDERTADLDLVCYSGWTLEKLVEMSREEPAMRELLQLCALLVDGPFILSQRSLALQFRGSANQRILSRDDIFRALEKSEA